MLRKDISLSQYLSPTMDLEMNCGEFNVIEIIIIITAIIKIIIALLNIIMIIIKY